MKTDTPTSAERAQFEEWAQRECGLVGEALKTRPDGWYEWGRTTDMLAAWLAGRAAMQAASPDTRAAFEDRFAGSTFQRNPAGHPCDYMDARVEALWDGYKAGREAMQAAEPVLVERIAHLEGEEEISEAVIGMMSRALASIAITLKGEEAALKRHSFHDLAELVQVMALELDLYKTIYGDKAPKGWESGAALDRAPSTTPQPWQDRMAAHYANGSVKCRSAEHFMVAEIDDWRNCAPITDSAAGWLPIDTAPLDKSILLWWRPINGNKSAEGSVIGQISSHEPGSWWNGQLGTYHPSWHITHWQPLPPAPAIAALQPEGNPV